MDTRTLVILLVAINVVIATVAVLIPWIRARRESAAPVAATARSAAATNGSAGGNGSAAHSATALTATTATGSGRAGDAATPWFPGPGAGTGAADGTEPAGPPGPPLDAATGLDLPGAWARWLTEEDARVQRFHRPATIVLVELAGLDRLADRFGDDAAGRLIPPIATTLRRDARATDHLARLGDTRFAALLPETTEVSPTRHANLALLDAERRLFAEREKARGQLARVDDEPPAEIPVLQPSAAARSAQA